MSELRNIPRLRFSDFNYEWTTDTLNSISNLNMGQSPNSSSYNQDEIGMPLIQGNADITNRKSKPRQWTTEPTKLCDDGDLIMTVRAPVGYISKSIHNACIGRGVCSIKPKGNNSIEFIYQFLLGYEKDWRRLEQGSTFTAVNSNDIKSIKLSFPSLPEQQKIADFLTSVDKRIELLEKKKTLLETYKKGVMKKIFNQEIRFKDDNGNDFPDWEEKRLGEICKLQGGYAFKSNSFKDTGIPIIRISNISNDNNYLNLENLVHYEEISNEENLTVLKGDLLIAMSGATTGKTSISNYDGKCYLNQRVGLFKSKTDKLNYSYLVQFVYSPMFGSQLVRFLVAGAQPNISSKDIESVRIPFPLTIEQQKISQFLSSIDTQLKLIETQIDKSKTWKKGLLQKMFV